MDPIFKNIVSISQRSHPHLYGKTKNVPWITKKMIDVLVLNFKAIFWLERRISVYSFGQKLRSNSTVTELQ